MDVNILEKTSSEYHDMYYNTLYTQVVFAFVFSIVVIFYCSYAIWLIMVKRKRKDFFIVSILVLIMVSMVAKILYKSERVNKMRHDDQ